MAEYSTVITPPQDAKVSYLTNDTLGSPRITTDQNGQTISRRDFMPFGEEAFTPERTQALGYGDDTVRQKFTGYKRDGETKLDFAGSRIYGFSFGRFMSADDFLKDSMVSEPQSWNKFVYARNNPLKYVDPEGEKATVTIETDEKNKTVTVKIRASIAFYAESGISKEARDKAASDAAQNIANAWSGTFKTKDGLTVKVETTIDYTTRDSKQGAEEAGLQNVVGFTNGDSTPGKANSQTGSGGFDVLSERPDYGRWNINTVNKTGDPAHEFGHLLGAGDRYSGNELMNTNIHSNPNNSFVPTETDFQWTFSGAISGIRSQSRPRIPNPETLGTGSHNTMRGDPQNSRSTIILRAGRIWWN